MTGTLGATTKADLDSLGALVEVESPSTDPEACRRCADVLADLGAERLGVQAERLEAGVSPALRWRFGGPTRILLVGHLDTVWPLGTLDEIPFRVEDGRATGPGVFDMKAGLVQAFLALQSLDRLDGVTLLVTSDEEIGSPGSRALIEAEATGAAAALVLEPSADGALKSARKGVSLYTLHVRGRAAHAGLEPERGVNALVELANQVPRIAALSAIDLGTTVTPTVAAAGTTTNTVPDAARVHVDARAASVAEQERVDGAMRALQPVLAGAELSVDGGPNRPPLPEESSAALVAAAERLAPSVGIGGLRAVAVGGGSDGNFTAGVGTPTLDGLGAVGAGAHARDEWVDVAAMAPRAALVAALIRELQEQA